MATLLHCYAHANMAGVNNGAIRLCNKVLFNMNSGSKVKFTPDELKQRLSSQTFHVIQEKGTEPAFTGKYHDHHEQGGYKCVVCGAQLFDSNAKFDSGTGWPSFDQALPGAIEFKEDNSHGMRRTEVTCANCGAHLGHVFDDLPRRSFDKAGGPQETTGKRYCINSCTLDFDKMSSFP